jgi:rhodanese-related sulfurtransferase
MTMFRSLFVAASLVVATTSLQAQIVPKPGDLLPRVTAAEAKSALDRNEGVIVDVRGSVPYDLEHIAGAISIPLGLLEAQADDLPKDKLIVLYCTCSAEQISGEGALKLQKAGFTKVGALSGGMKAWAAAGFPIVKSTEPVEIPADAITPATAPVFRGRMMPPELVTCDRNQLTSFAGVVSSYTRKGGKTTIVIKTDDDTVETIRLKGSKRSALQPQFLIEAAKFAAADWSRIESREGVLRSGTRAVAWVCSAPPGRTWVNWQPAVTSGH